MKSGSSLLGLTQFELEEWAKSCGYPSYRGRQLYHWLYQERILDFSLMSNLPASLRDELNSNFLAQPLQEVKRAEDFDGSMKLLLEAPDGARIETVLIPEGLRMTACLSSQVGCAVGCRFCATGLMGFKRNLTPGEILAQLLALENATGKRMTNVVMMGMGEPLLNRPAVFKAIPLLADQKGIGLSRQHVTISTAGWLPGIRSLTNAVKRGYHLDPSIDDIRNRKSADDVIPPMTIPAPALRFPRIKLAISLNTTLDEERRVLMPLTGKYPLLEILDAAADYARASAEVVSINYLLLAGQNDSDEDANRLARMLTSRRMAGYNPAKQAPSEGKSSTGWGIDCFKVNLMEYNPVGEQYQRASSDRVESFLRILGNTGLKVTVRTSRGRDITAACGQLATETKTDTSIT